MGTGSSDANLSLGAKGAASLSETDAILSAARVNERIAQANGRRAALDVEFAIKRGEKDARDIHQQGRSAIGSQRVALAAQGIEIGVGTAASLEEDTLFSAENAAMRLRNNASLEALGLQQDSISADLQAEIASNASRGQAVQTLLSGANRIVGERQAFIEG